MGNRITTKLIRHDLPGFASVTADQPLEKPLRSSSIPPGLQEHINNLAILVHSSPKIVLLPVDLNGPAHRRRPRRCRRCRRSHGDCFSRYGDASLGQKIFNISVAEVESKVQPNGIGNDIGWESMALICIHPQILPITVTLLGSTCLPFPISEFPDSRGRAQAAFPPSESHGATGKAPFVQPRLAKTKPRKHPEPECFYNLTSKPGNVRLTFLSRATVTLSSAQCTPGWCHSNRQ